MNVWGYFFTQTSKQLFVSTGFFQFWKKEKLTKSRRQKSKNAAFNWSFFDSDIVKLSNPAWDTEMFKLSDNRVVLSAKMLSLKVMLKIEKKLQRMAKY